jgi:hypothetical protein
MVPKIFIGKGKKEKGIKSGMYMVRSLKTLYWCENGDIDSGDGSASLDNIAKNVEISSTMGSYINVVTRFWRKTDPHPPSSNISSRN